ncbi:phage baseplate assembly protein [Mesorhizobium sp. KR2-14]|uniref:phage baseplate assembly protein n=1 Tax=Mesorhizobium sp. KR2-14 TaxID=3156610 RepID=UPI0032B34F2F
MTERRDPLETLSLEVGGNSLTGWSEVEIEYGVEQAVRCARLVISDFEGELKIRPDMPATIKASGDLIITGYVRDVEPEHDENSHKVTVSVVSKAVDLVETSIDHPSGFVSQKDIGEIAKTFDTEGVGVEVDEDFPVEPASFVNTGDSWFYHMEPMTRSHGAFIYDTPEGKIRIAYKPRGRHDGGLTIGDGGNIIAASAKLTGKARYSEVIVRGQSSRGRGAAALRLEARARDGSVGRSRKRIIVHESETTAGKLKRRAKREVKRAAGSSREANITVAGWRDDKGRIFEPHFLIGVDNARIYLQQDMAIKSVRLMQSTEQGGAGTRAELCLCDPRALNGEKPAGKAAKKTGEVWDMPDADPTISAQGTVGVDY